MFEGADGEKGVGQIPLSRSKSFVRYLIDINAFGLA
jgi:hypothetical protein